MYTRITRTDGLYDRDIVIDFLCTGIVPTFQCIPGYRGLVVGADPMTGTVWTMSSWDSPEAIQITDELSEHLRETWLASTHRLLRGVDVYEVRSEMVASSGPTVGCTLRILPFTARDAVTLDTALARLRDDLLPVLTAQKGLHLLRVLVDSGVLGGMVVSGWDDTDTARAACEAIAGARGRLAASGIELGRPVEQEIIFAHVLTRTP